MINKWSIARRAALRYGCAGLACVALVLNTGSGIVFSAADADPQSIKDVEAAFVYQFTRYVEWPTDSFERTGNEFAITVVGDPAFSQALESLVSDKGFDGRSYRVAHVDDVAQAPFAQIVFVGETADPVNAIDSGLSFDGQALTVSDHETFTREGGIMRLYEDENRLRIEVNIDAARRSELKISSKLLDLARIVRDETN